MKKIISCILLLTLCLGLLAGCTPTENATSGLASAKTYLYNMYKDTEGTVTKVNYTRVGVVNIQDVGTYNVTWTSSTDAITITPDGKMVNITINGTNEEEIKYTLTATISDDKGNTETQVFNYTLPAAGKPGELKDGTYVITDGVHSMTALDANKNYGYPSGNDITITNGKISGYTAEDIFTIKNVEGGVTLQDHLGRYYYLKGTFNSPNLSTTLPEEGHIWKISVDGDKISLVNTLNGRTLAYSSQHTSWGAYDELTDGHASALTIVAVAAGSGSSTSGGSTSSGSTSTGSEPACVTAPEVGKTYKLGLWQSKKGEVYYFTGAMSSYYGATETDKSKGVDVVLEDAGNGKYYISFTVNGTKNYIYGEANGTHLNFKFGQTKGVFTWDAEHKTFTTTIGETAVFMGTYDNYVTFGMSKIEKLDSSYAAHLYN